MQQINTQYYQTPYGELILGSVDARLCLCDWRYRSKREAVDARLKKGLSAEFVEQDDALLRSTRQQLEEYFQHRRKAFDLPLQLVGTAFQQKIWQALQMIPFGQTASYLQLAETIGDKKSVRAVASANGANAISIIIPCHRIIGSNGDLVGYAGGLKTKASLLGLEFDLFN